MQNRKTEKYRISAGGGFLLIAVFCVLLRIVAYCSIADRDFPLIMIDFVSFERGQNRLKRRRFYPPSSFPRLPGFLVLLVGESLAVPTGGQAFAGCFGQSGRVWSCPPQAGGYVLYVGEGRRKPSQTTKFSSSPPGPSSLLSLAVCTPSVRKCVQCALHAARARLVY